MYLVLFPCICLSVDLSRSLYIFFFLSLSLSLSLSLLSLSISLPIYLSVYLPTYLSISSISISISLPIYLSVWLAICLFLDLLLSLSLFFKSPSLSLSFSSSTVSPIHLSIDLSIHLSIYPFIRLSIFPSIYLSVCLKGSNSAKLPQKMEVDSSKTKRSARLPSKMESGVQSWQPRTNVFAIFPPHLFEVLRLPRKSEARPYKVLHLSPKIILGNLTCDAPNCNPSQEISALTS